MMEYVVTALYKAVVQNYSGRKAPTPWKDSRGPLTMYI